jgi:hypothetical protein
VGSGLATRGGLAHRPYLFARAEETIQDAYDADA